MKPILTLTSLTLALLFGSLCLGIPNAAAQEETSPRDAIMASIPTPSNFEEQADSTFVGDVVGSYAFIAFVVRDGFAVVYLCDNVLSHWLSGEIVDNTLDVTAEDGTHVVATILEDHIEGTVTLKTDDDGGEANSHAFTAVLAVPGETGLARHVEPLNEELNIVSGWIVIEKGVRGDSNTVPLRRRNTLQEACTLLQNTSDLALERFNNEVLMDGSAMAAQGWWQTYIDTQNTMTSLGC